MKPKFTVDLGQEVRIGEVTFSTPNATTLDVRAVEGVVVEVLRKERFTRIARVMWDWKVFFWVGPIGLIFLEQLINMGEILEI